MSYAKMRVMIEVDAPGSYGPGWTLDDMFKQTKQEAMQILRAAVGRDRIRIVGEPEMVAVITEEKSS